MFHAPISVPSGQVIGHRTLPPQLKLFGKAVAGRVAINIDGLAQPSRYSLFGFWFLLHCYSHPYWCLQIFIFSKNNTWLKFPEQTVSVETCPSISSWYLLLLMPCTPAVTGWAYCRVYLPKYRSTCIISNRLPVDVTRCLPPYLSTSIILSVLLAIRVASLFTIHCLRIRRMTHDTLWQCSEFYNSFAPSNLFSNCIVRFGPLGVQLTNAVNLSLTWSMLFVQDCFAAHLIFCKQHNFF